MRTRLPLWSIPVLSLIVVLGCTPRQAEPPTDTGTTRGENTSAVLDPAAAPFSREVYVLVSTNGNTFSVSPDPVIVHNRSQKVIWVAEDPDVAIEVSFRPDKGKDTPGVKPPGNPCAAPARKCGENQPIGGDVGQFYYDVAGTKAGQRMEPLDPVLEILY